MMINLNNSLKLFVITILLQIFNISGANASTKYISIATGGITGVYYPAGGAVCRFVNRGRKDHGIRCSVESTGGSVANLNAIRKGFSDFGIVQSDWQYHAYNGTGFFSDQSLFKDLRAVFSLYTETFTLAVREGGGIDTVDDIPGKRVNFGPEGSGMHATMEVLSKVKGWTKAAFGAITNLDPVKQVQALCNNKIDVMIYMSGNPNGVLQEATQYQDPNCKVKILSIDKESVNKLTKLNPFYVKAIVPGGMYRGNPNNIYTFGVKATFVTSNKTSEDIVYNVTKTVMQDFNNFKTLHPVFASLNKERSIREGNSAPLHKGAIRYYKEAGLL